MALSTRLLVRRLAIRALAGGRVPSWMRPQMRALRRALGGKLRGR